MDPGAPSTGGPDDNAQPRRIIGRGLGAEDLALAMVHRARGIIQQREDCGHTIASQQVKRRAQLRKTRVNAAGPSRHRFVGPAPSSTAVPPAVADLKTGLPGSLTMGADLQCTQVQ